MKIVLFQPEIPQNTGNIARTAAATQTGLVLVRPFGFSTASRHMKRAGLDYWDKVALEEIDDLPSYLQGKTPLFFSSKAKRLYTEAPFTPDSLLIFGSETSGLPNFYWETWQDNFYRIPMVENVRCLNLASSAAVVLYEALRQTNFQSLKRIEETNETMTLHKKALVKGT